MAGTINWSITKDDAALIGKIVDRHIEVARELEIAPHDRATLHMDLTECHLNGCPLDLPKLLGAPRSDFCHDVGGIWGHIDRNTGQLLNCFLPRCSAH